MQDLWNRENTRSVIKLRLQKWYNRFYTIFVELNNLHTDGNIYEWHIHTMTATSRNPHSCGVRAVCVCLCVCVLVHACVCVCARVFVYVFMVSASRTCVERVDFSYGNFVWKKVKVSIQLSLYSVVELLDVWFWLYTHIHAYKWKCL